MDRLAESPARRHLRGFLLAQNNSKDPAEAGPLVLKLRWSCLRACLRHTGTKYALIMDVPFGLARH
jgi:hypothetical protein